MIEFIFGGIMAAIPKIFGMLERAQDHKQSLEMQRLSATLGERKYEQDLGVASFHKAEALGVAERESYASHIRSIAEMESSYKPAQWVDNIRALVRPFLTVFLMVLMMIVTLVGGEAAKVAVDLELASLLYMAMGYWFVDRNWSKK